MPERPYHPENDRDADDAENQGWISMMEHNATIDKVRVVFETAQDQMKAQYESAYRSIRRLWIIAGLLISLPLAGVIYEMAGRAVHCVIVPEEAIR